MTPWRPYITSAHGVVHNGQCRAVAIAARHKPVTDNQLLVYRAVLSACPVCVGPVTWAQIANGGQPVHLEVTV